MDIPALTKCHILLQAVKPPNRIETVRRYPFFPNTIGDYLRKKRLDLGLLQKDVADRLNTSTECLRNWENNMFEPDIRSFPNVIDFIGYCPYDLALAASDKMIIWRSYNGLTQKEMAKLARIDPGTLSRIEKGKMESTKAKLYMARVKTLIRRFHSRNDKS